MTGYDENNTALTLGDDESLRVGEYELSYNSGTDEWEVRYDRPIGGENGFHLKTGSGRIDSFSKVGSGALRFGSENGVSAISEQSDLNLDDTGFTFSCWVYIRGGTGSSFNRILSYQDMVAFDTFVIYWDDDGSSGYGVNFKDDSAILPEGSSPPQEQWVHFTGVVDGTNVLFYQDGTEEVSVAQTESIVDQSSAVLSVGGRAQDTNDSFYGSIDDVRIYGRALSASEVADLSNGVDITDGLLTHHTFEYPEAQDIAVDVTGDIYPRNTIPRSSSDSLVPSGLAESVSAGEALADDGNTYSSVQTAVDNATGWVFVGPGTFTESVSISTAGLMLEGCGSDTLIDGANIGSAIGVSAPNVTIQNLNCQSNTTTAIFGNGRTDMFNLDVVGNGGGCVDAGVDNRIVSCRLIGATGTAISRGEGMMLRNTTIIDAGNNGISGGGDGEIVANNRIINVSGSGVGTANNDGIVTGNRVINSGADGIIFSSTTDYVLTNNRVSGSGGNEINDGGAGTAKVGNKTGPAN